MQHDLPWIHEVLDQGAWRAQARSHRERYEPQLNQEVGRRNDGRPDPTLDFLFQYYKLRPRKFLRYSPGFGVLLQGPAARGFLSDERYAECDAGVYLRPEGLPTHRRPALTWIRRLLHNTAQRAPYFGCFGMHEWALVHDCELMHPSFELRASREEIADQLERIGLRCTHYDAYRFFSPVGQRLNEHALTADGMPDTEQPGCLHTNMDLYRWAQKLSPWVSAPLLGRTLELAWETRTMDSRVSPYDLTPAGWAPLAPETEVGRQEFVAGQRRIAALAAPLRQELIVAYDRVLHWME